LRPQKRQISHHVEYLASVAIAAGVLNTFLRGNFAPESWALLIEPGDLAVRSAYDVGGVDCESHDPVTLQHQ
jgi:hypothetical protein